LTQLETETRSKINSLQKEQELEAQKLKSQRLQSEFDREQKIKRQSLENAVTSKSNASNFEFVELKKRLQEMNALQNEHNSEQVIKHKLKMEALIIDNQREEIEQNMKLTDAMNEQLNISQIAMAKQQNLQKIMQKEEEFEMNAMCERHSSFKQNIQSKNEQILHEHKDQMLQQLESQQIKLEKLSKQQRLKQFDALLKRQSDVKANELDETINFIKQQIESTQAKELQMEFTEKELLEQSAFDQIAKDAEEQIIEQETEKYANIRTRMLDKMKEKEETLRQRHEEIMINLMREREKQLLSIGQNAKNNVHKANISEIEEEYEAKTKELKAMQESFNQKQDSIRQQLIEHNLSLNES